MIEWLLIGLSWLVIGFRVMRWSILTFEQVDEYHLKSHELILFCVGIMVWPLPGIIALFHKLREEDKTILTFKKRKKS